MTVSYICLACRAQRTILSSAGPRTSGTRSRQSVNGQRALYGGADGQSSRHALQGGRVALRDPASETVDGILNGYTGRVGRYSKQPLGPQEILTQLDQERGPHTRRRTPSAGPARSFIEAPRKPPVEARGRIPMEDTRKTTQWNPQTTSETEPSHSRPRTTQTSAHAALESRVRDIIEQAKRDPFNAWSALQEMEAEYMKLKPTDRVSLTFYPNFAVAIKPLLLRVVDRWVQSLKLGTTSTVPGPSNAFRTLRRLRSASHWHPHPVLITMTEGLANLILPGHLTDPGVLKLAISELMEIWKRAVLSTSPSKPTKPSTNSDPTAVRPSVADEFDWSFLPSKESFEQSESLAVEPDMTFEAMLRTLARLPKSLDATQANEARYDYATPALLTLEVVRETCSVIELPQHAPFIDLLEGLLKAAPQSRVPPILATRMTGMSDKLLLERYEAMIKRSGLKYTPITDPAKPSKARETIAPSHEKHDELNDSKEEFRFPFSEPPQTPEIEKFATEQISFLFNARERRDAMWMERIRSNVCKFAQLQNLEPNVLPIEVYEHLMLAFLEARHPESAVEVWTHMCKAGYKMRVNTYTAVMRGAQFSRDLSGLHSMWKRMRQAGIQPDHQAWSTRIFGLLRMKQTRDGLLALSEMGKEWHAAAHEQHARENKSTRKNANTPELSIAQLLIKYPGDINGVPRPNCAVMNSAISALANTADWEVGKAVAWGRTFGIEPDLITYNTLMNIAMRHSKANDALKILQRMRERGIEPDSTTWTVLLTALFQGGFLDGLDHAAQEKKVFGLLDTLTSESDNFSFDVKAYALIIDRLLKVHSNVSAASAVLNHMLENGRQPTPHIYTILMSNYFDSQPPNFPAIEALWARIEDSKGSKTAPMDGIFFDRMIEGYAKLHHEVGIQPMLDFLRHSQHLGIKPGWRAQECVARALAERGEWNRLSGLVQDVRTRLRTSYGATQNHGQADFWDFVISTGVLNNKGITRREQLMPKETRPSPLMRA
ncbi:hypothetical protein TI39_contig380g00002 [Zymoseptoria brevis]|uniref:Pentatricopeptide repeat protein n=1 Tax=Zymoseptoria brevis TaxID=1047168 RepID=A0A0F4GPI6_9PEZI|nr:hypothetical protein TI39_contig380g00002 [Zymoseptoria brevis]